MTCKDCFHYEACSGFTPTDLDQDVFDYCRKGIADEIPDIEERCSCFMDKADVVEVVRCRDCKYYKPQTRSITWNNTSKYCCRGANVKVNEDDYCSYGERSKNDNT